MIIAQATKGCKFQSHVAPNRENKSTMRIAIVLFFLLIGSTSLPGQTPAAEVDSWYSSFLANQQVGYVRETYKAAGQDNILLTTTKISINRIKAKAEMTVESEFTEDVSTGILKSIRSTVKASNQGTKSIFLNGKDSMTLIQEMGGKSYTRKLAAQGPVYGPSWIKQNSVKLLRKQGDKFQYKTFSADFGMYLTGTRTVLSLETTGGKSVLVIEESFAEMPAKRRLWVDDQFGVLRMVDASPFGDMESLLSTEEKALTDVSRVILPAELFDRALSKSSIRLPDARAIESITIEISKRQSSNIVLPDLTTEFQRVLEKNDDKLVLQVSVPALNHPTKANTTEKSIDLTEYLQPNALINSDDPQIVRIAQDVTRDLKDSRAKCLALEDWVSRNMSFDTGVVIAPASEVCKDRKGTCASYSTFLAALFRAVGIPSRYNIGYIYMSGTWAGHAWADANIDGQWVPFDASVNGEGTADAARFSFGSTSLKNGSGEFGSMAGGLMYGNVNIKVISFTSRGKTTVVDRNQPGYDISSNTYFNKSLNLRITKPLGFEFTDMEKMWPEPTVVGLSNESSNEKIAILQLTAKPFGTRDEMQKTLLLKQVGDGVYSTSRYKGAKIIQITNSNVAAVAIQRGQDVWVVRAESKNSAKLLAQALNWFEL